MGRERGEEESLGTVKGIPGRKREVQPASPDRRHQIRKNRCKAKFRDCSPAHGKGSRANITERDSRHAPPPKNDGQGLKHTGAGPGKRERMGQIRNRAQEGDKPWAVRWRGVDSRERRGAAGKEAVERMDGVDMGGREPAQRRVELGQDSTHGTGKRRAAPAGSEKSEKRRAGRKR